ncbi:MAG: 16S rRNA (uracil(1498)-N(3))-methyltransferase [Caldilineales bacterium]|nr:16S rRNA (uracil(1498)-N(3))-methyltransferase [Caldilineales bacterium]
MHRFFVTPAAIQADRIRFSPEQARQMRSVLRLKPGDQVFALDGEGACFQVTVEYLGKQDAVGHIQQRMEAGGEPGGEIILCQAIARGDRFEWVLQKGVELGVTHFQPMITRRTVRKTPGDSSWRRWQRIIMEAAEQSGRGRVPELLPVVDFAEAIRQRRGTALLPAVAAAEPVTDYLSGISWPVTIFIGPEGGFAAEEVEFARAQGLTPVGLGPRVLRTETAALALLTLALDRLGEFTRSAPGAAQDM